MFGIRALADLLFATVETIIGIPVFWTCKWSLEKAFVKYLKVLLTLEDFFSIFVYYYRIIDRYLAIVKPFNQSPFQLPLCFWIFLAFLFSIASVIPVFIDFNVSKNGVCLGDWAQRSSKSLIYSLYLLIGTFMIPLYFYCFVTRIFWQNMANLKTSGNTTALLQNRSKSNRRAMLILLAIAIALVFPNRIVWVIVSIINTGNMSDSAFRTVKYFSRFPYLFPYFHLFTQLSIKSFETNW